MAKRGRTSRRQRAAGEAARRAAASRRLSQAPPRQRAQEGLATVLPAPARQAWREETDAVQVSVCEAGCEVCSEARGRFETLRAESLVQRRRFDQQARYPYAAGKHTLHRTGCRRVSVRDVESGNSPWLHGALTEFAHTGSTNSRWATHMQVMAPHEVAAWITERIGPRGGLRYRLCRVCAPELPVASPDDGPRPLPARSLPGTPDRS